ncbi:suppressor of fused domain protein [Paracidovorax cattleyae]|uniref:suppressor of fused domain protein n=1 Tax=Paracidovorax cattleyae TaxID=80868 RepID=UPI000B196B9A|nr:suppressor of fused domain protein [Paracidovorax cattleyae]MBF9265041.1 suppressor of fused domain protein [Paracidovorax cattleyae]
MEKNEKTRKEKEFSFDVRRSIILASYINSWSMPEYRLVMEDGGKNIRIEVYYFPALDEDSPARFATVGLSNTKRKSSGELFGVEWMLALQKDMGGESVDRIYNYLCDLMAHHIENIDGSKIPRVMGESDLAPQGWSTKAFLLDELRGESEGLEHIKIGSQEVRVLWALPITGKEADLVVKSGVEVFDEYMENIDYSIIDTLRP